MYRLLRFNSSSSSSNSSSSSHCCCCCCCKDCKAISFERFISLMTDKQHDSSNCNYNKHNDHDNDNDDDDTELGEVFRVFDANNDGRITADELSKILHCLGEHISEVVV